MIFIVIIAVLALFFLVIDVVDINRFVIKEYEIKSDKINKEQNIVLLADLHNKEFGKNNKKLIDAINDINPDFVLCAGDMLTAKPGKDYSPAVRFFENMKMRPVYYGLGNHEYRMKIYPEDYGTKYEEYASKLRELGVNILENDHLDIEGTNIRIQGLMIDRHYYKRFEHHEMTKDDIRTLTGTKDEDKFEIMIAHNPEYFPGYAEANAELIVSGHVHGGIMKLPLIGGVISPKLKLFPRFDGGIFTYKNSTMILSRGLGCHTLPLRIFNPGELVVIKLLPCQKH